MFPSVRLLKFLEKTQIRNYVKKRLPVDNTDLSHLTEHEYAVKSSQSTMVFTWGLGEHGALGHYIQKRQKMKNRKDPRFRQFVRPFRHTFGEVNEVKDIAAGFGFSAFLLRKTGPNKVWGTGINTDSQIGYHESRKDTSLHLVYCPVPIQVGFKDPINTKVVSISAGRAHLAIATNTEGVYTLGNNAYGQCGRTIIEDENYTGSRVVHRIPSFGGEQVQSVECGQDHTLFLTESGKVYACGWGADGQTGLGHYDAQPHPMRVKGDIEGEKIVKISSKCDFALALNDKGKVFGWGNSEYSQLFNNSSPLQQINQPIHLKKCEGFGKIIDVATAGSFCMMLNEAGEVFSWGFGILGRGPSASHSWAPELIPPILFGKNDFQPECTVKSIYCGLHYSGAINSYGHIYTWGKNKGGCLGLGFKNDQLFPLRVCIGATAKKLALGVDHSLALCRPF